MPFSLKEPVEDQMRNLSLESFLVDWTFDTNANGLLLGAIGPWLSDSTMEPQCFYCVASFGASGQSIFGVACSMRLGPLCVSYISITEPAYMFVTC